MGHSSPNPISIQVETRYIEQQSEPESDQFVFAYSIQIRNLGSKTVQLLSRYWLVRHGNGKIEEVQGDGVVGEQPHIEPGHDFRYASGSIIETEVGTMEGYYEMIAEDGTAFRVEIPRFTLAIPRTVH